MLNCLEEGKTFTIQWYKNSFRKCLLNGHKYIDLEQLSPWLIFYEQHVTDDYYIVIENKSEFPVNFSNWVRRKKIVIFITTQKINISALYGAVRVTRSHQKNRRRHNFYISHILFPAFYCNNTNKTLTIHEANQG